MDYLEAIQRIETHRRVHHMLEQPRCEKITEALSLAIQALEQCEKLGGRVGEFNGLPVEAVSFDPGSTILIRFNTDEDSLDYVRSAFDSLKEAFPFCNVTVLPKTMDLQKVSAGELRQIRSYIDRILEERAV